jgi:hypothetical protein
LPFRGLFKWDVARTELARPRSTAHFAKNCRLKDKGRIAGTAWARTFIAQDEVLNQATALSAKQRDNPRQAHAHGFVASLTLGLIINTVLNLLQAPPPMPRQSVSADQRELPAHLI